MPAGLSIVIVVFGDLSTGPGASSPCLRDGSPAGEGDGARLDVPAQIVGTLPSLVVARGFSGPFCWAHRHRLDSTALQLSGRRILRIAS